jgi:hypothetical protein
VAVLIAGLALLTGCSGNGNDSEATADTGETGAATTTTETGPPPITAAEERWVEEIDRLARKMTRASDRVRVYTNAAMTGLAKTNLTCSRSLKRIDPPGRLEPAARLARQGCKKFERSAKAMRMAVAIDAAGVYSQEQADKYNALVEKALETQGNGINALERARSRADQIAASLPLD